MSKFKDATLGKARKFGNKVAAQLKSSVKREGAASSKEPRSTSRGILKRVILNLGGKKELSVEKQLASLEKKLSKLKEKGRFKQLDSIQDSLEKIKGKLPDDKPHIRHGFNELERKLKDNISRALDESSLRSQDEINSLNLLNVSNEKGGVDPEVLGRLQLHVSALRGEIEELKLSKNPMAEKILSSMETSIRPYEDLVSRV